MDSEETYADKYWGITWSVDVAREEFKKAAKALRDALLVKSHPHENDLQHFKDLFVAVLIPLGTKLGLYSGNLHKFSTLKIARRSPALFRGKEQLTRLGAIIDDITWLDKTELWIESNHYQSTSFHHPEQNGMHRTKLKETSPICFQLQDILNLVAVAFDPCAENFLLSLKKTLSSPVTFIGKLALLMTIVEVGEILQLIKNPLTHWKNDCVKYCLIKCRSLIAHSTDILTVVLNPEHDQLFKDLALQLATFLGTEVQELKDCSLPSLIDDLAKVLKVKKSSVTSEADSPCLKSEEKNAKEQSDKIIESFLRRPTGYQECHRFFRTLYYPASVGKRNSMYEHPESSDEQFCLSNTTTNKRDEMAAIKKRDETIIKWRQRCGHVLQRACLQAPFEKVREMVTESVNACPTDDLDTLCEYVIARVEKFLKDSNTVNGHDNLRLALKMLASVLDIDTVGKGFVVGIQRRSITLKREFFDYVLELLRKDSRHELQQATRCLICIIGNILGEWSGSDSNCLSLTKCQKRFFWVLRNYYAHVNRLYGESFATGGYEYVSAGDDLAQLAFHVMIIIWDFSSALQPSSTSATSVIAA